jgi:RimJ/RimL family protein N-acetyltransferase
MGGTPPDEVAAGNVRVRRWRLEDAPDLHALLLANLEHLRPWMGWVAAEPLLLEERRSKIAAWRARWGAGEDFAYAIVDDAGGELLGGCGLNRRIAPDALDLGYWVRGDRTSQGVAADAAGALVEAAFTVDGITHVEIHHDAANAASRRIPEKLGFTFLGERQAAIVAPAEVGIDVTWRLDRDPGRLGSRVPG